MNVDPAFRRFRTRLSRKTLALGLAVGALLGGLLGQEAALGFWLGTVASALCLHLHARCVETTAALAPQAALRRARAASIPRTAVRATALLAAALRPELSFPATSVALFAPQLVLLADYTAPKTSPPG